MTDFLAQTLNVVKDGILSINEVLFFAIVVVIGLLLLIFIIGQIKKFIYNHGPGRKKTIFSHRKNQYTNRIGKKSKASKKKKF